MPNRPIPAAALKPLRLALISGASLTIALASLTQPAITTPLLKWGIPLGVLVGVPIIGGAILTAETPQISVQDLKAKRDRQPSQILLIDVRSPGEFAQAHLPGAVLIPIDDIEQGPGLQQIQQQLGDRQLITYCHSGPRSQRALAKLRQAGIPGQNLTGGIIRWRDQIDPSLPKDL